MGQHSARGRTPNAFRVQEAFAAASR